MRGERRRRRCEREPEIRALVGEPCRRPDADEPVRAAGDRVPLEGDRPHDLRKGQRQHGEIDARQPHAEPAEDERRPRARRAGRAPSATSIGAPCLTASAARVGAETEVRGMPERRHAAGAHHELQACGEQREHEHVGGEHQRVLVARKAAAARPAPARRAAASAAARPGGTTSARCSAICVVGGIDGARTQQAVRPDGEHDRHHDEFGDQRELRKRDRSRRRRRRCRARCTAP